MPDVLFGMLSWQLPLYNVERIIIQKIILHHLVLSNI